MITMTDINKLVQILSKIEKDLHSIDISLGIIAETRPPRDGFKEENELKTAKID